MRGKPLVSLTIAACLWCSRGPAEEYRGIENVVVPISPSNSRPVPQCTDIHSSMSVEAKSLDNYQYCRVMEGVDFGVGASVQNLRRQRVSCTVCAIDAAGNRFGCGGYSLGPGQKLGGWASDWVWCGSRPVGVEYKCGLEKESSECSDLSDGNGQDSRSFKTWVNVFSRGVGNMNSSPIPQAQGTKPDFSKNPFLQSH